ncbi:MAG: hypothetical protein ACE5IM_11995 [Nitrospinota bacterium]
MTPARRLRNQALAAALLAAVFFLVPAAAAPQGYAPHRALVGVRSNFSSGSEPVESIARKAEKSGFSAVLFADHHRLSLFWGVPPFRNLLRKRQEFSSVHLSGVRSYLKAVLAADERHPRTLITPGLTTTPFYYWTGSPFRGDLTAHQWHTRLLVFGLRNPALARLPEVHGSFSTAYVRQLWPGAALFLAAALMGLALFIRYPRWRALGFLLFLAGGLFSINYHPFAATPFDVYHGDQGVAPYQLLIDYVKARGGVVLWTAEGKGVPGGERAGVARLVSRPRPDLLAAARGYVAFDAFMGGTPPPTAPGGVWDAMLQAFTDGKRRTPVWIFGSAGGRRKTAEGLEAYSEEVQTVFYLKEKTQAALLDALRRGRMYALKAGGGFYLRLDRFAVTPRDLSAEALPGQRLNAPGPVAVHFRVSASDGRRRPVTVRIVRDGRVVKTLRGETPFERTYRDPFTLPGRTSFYRVEASGPSGTRLLTNPVFVKFLKAAPSKGPDRPGSGTVP